jgi:hypothetical protein
MCIWYVGGLLDVVASLITDDGNVRSLVWNGLLPGLFLISYVVNIGFSRAWGKRPAIASVAVIAAVAAIGFLVEGIFETLLLARVIWVWEVYLFSHLGLAFVISAIIGTPGCEMRAFHDLYSRISGAPTKEHYCPVGPLHPIDQWEAGRGRD